MSVLAAPWVSRVLRSDIALCALSCGAFVQSMYWWIEPRQSLWNMATFWFGKSAKQKGIAGGEGDKKTPDAGFTCTKYERDDPANIRKRLVSIVAVCGGAILALGKPQGVTPAELWVALRRGWARCLFGLGGGDATVLEVATHTRRAVALTGALFAGVLVDLAIDTYDEISGSSFADWLKGKTHDAISVATSDKQRMIFLRNYVICPLGEEVFFRALQFAFLQNRRPWARVWMSAVIFGLAHTHHFVRYLELAVTEELGSTRFDIRDYPDEYCRVKRKAMFKASMQTISAFVIPFAFGLMGGAQFLLCGQNCAATAISHSFCNWVGPPSLYFIQHERRRWVTVLVGGSHVVGIVSFFSSVVSANRSLAQ